MKFLRRNDRSNKNGDASSYGSEIMHLKAISLTEELNERTRIESRDDESGRNVRERQHPLDPKRLLCFNNKIKKDQRDKPERKRSPWRSRRIVEYDVGRNTPMEVKRQSTGDVSDLCHELCQDYYEIRKKLKNRPIVLTTKKAQVLDAIAGSNSTSSSTDAPLRKFDNHTNKNDKSCLHYSNENRELHRRQCSLLDDNGSVHSDNIEVKSNRSHNKYRRQISGAVKSNGNASKTNSSKKHKSRVYETKSNQSYSNRSGKEWDSSLQISTSESTEYTIPIPYVGRSTQKHSLQPDISMISTMTSASYSTCDESTVILSPRAANDKVSMSSKSNQNAKRSNLGLVCSPTPYTIRQHKSKHRESRNPGNAGISASNLGMISEGADYSSSSSSSSASSDFLSSSYGSSSTESYSESSFGDSSFGNEECDLSVLYINKSLRESFKKTGVHKKKQNNPTTGCTIAGGDFFKAIMFDEDANSIAENESFGNKAGRKRYQ